jgi:hypothetical protein
MSIKKAADKALSWIVSGVFVIGAYAIGHCMLKLQDGTMLAFTGWLIWSDMANHLNKDDAADAAAKR